MLYRYEQIGLNEFEGMTEMRKGGSIKYDGKVVVRKMALAHP
jgi:hypothetical protein